MVDNVNKEAQNSELSLDGSDNGVYKRDGYLIGYSDQSGQDKAITSHLSNEEQTALDNILFKLLDYGVRLKITYTSMSEFRRQDEHWLLVPMYNDGKKISSTNAEVSSHSPDNYFLSVAAPLCWILTPELKEVILNDDKIKTLPLFSHEWDMRMEELRVLNNLEYRLNSTPKWVKDHKWSKPYLVSEEEYQKRYSKSYQ